jgi:hypothetical protein
MLKVFLLIALATLPNQQVNCCQGITPLRTNRAEVEKILGPPLPTSKAIDAAMYETARERIFVLYSTGPCGVKPSNGWNAPLGTVINFSVAPREKPRFVELNLDESKFAKNKDPELPEITYYTSDEDGLSITVDTVDGVVRTFRYSPGSKDEHFRCPASD